jgi:hypothetical protein
VTILTSLCPFKLREAGNIKFFVLLELSLTTIKETSTMGRKEKKEEDDTFNVLEEITEMQVDEEEKARLAEKAEKKRLKKEMSKEERQAQREINRKNREKKKSKKDLNKKRKVEILKFQFYSIDVNICFNLERRID